MLTPASRSSPKIATEPRVVRTAVHYWRAAHSVQIRACESSRQGASIPLPQPPPSLHLFRNVASYASPVRRSLPLGLDLTQGWSIKLWENVSCLSLLISCCANSTTTHSAQTVGTFRQFVSGLFRHIFLRYPFIQCTFPLKSGSQPLFQQS